MILLLDAYDSFTHNLAELLRRSGCDHLIIRRCDAISVREAVDLDPTAIVLSPGPGRPESRGIALPLLQEAATRRIPTLGICLGHQAIGQSFGMRTRHAPQPVHGEEHPIRHAGSGLFRGLTPIVTVMRYHSLVLDPATLPSELEITATLAEQPDVIMGLRHRSLPIEGIQFHPESFLSPDGPCMIQNFLESLR